MNAPKTADARRFRLSLAASLLLNLGLLLLAGRLNRPDSLLPPQGRPHIRLVTLSLHPAPPSSGRRGVESAAKLTAATASPLARQPRPRRSEPVPRRRPKALRIVTTTRPAAHALSLSARTIASTVPFDLPVRAPPPAVLRPRLLLPVRPAAPTPMPDLSRPTTARQEASRGTDGGGTGWEASTGAYTGRKAGGPFGIGDGLAASGVTRHIVYVLDISGSMTSRMDRAEDELTQALRGLGPGETFNIIAFSGGSRLFDPDMADATPGRVQQASGFLRELEVGGDTNLEAAVTRALMLRDVNEVVILTDGVPTVGETDPEKLAAVIRRFNLRHARISAIGMVGRNADGTDDSFAAAQMLQQIAQDSDGVAKIVTVGVASH